MCCVLTLVLKPKVRFDRGFHTDRFLSTRGWLVVPMANGLNRCCFKVRRRATNDSQVRKRSIRLEYCVEYYPSLFVIGARGGWVCRLNKAYRLCLLQIIALCPKLRIYLCSEMRDFHRWFL